MSLQSIGPYMPLQDWSNLVGKDLKNKIRGTHRSLGPPEDLCYGVGLGICGGGRELTVANIEYAKWERPFLVICNPLLRSQICQDFKSFMELT